MKSFKNTALRGLLASALISSSTLALAQTAGEGENTRNGFAAATVAAPAAPANNLYRFVNRAGMAEAGHLGQYRCRYDNGRNIDFNINITDTTIVERFEGKLELAVWDVDADTEHNNPEIDTVFVNGTKVGVLYGTDQVWVVNSFNIPKGVLKQGVNAIRVTVDDGMDTRTGNGTKWCSQIDWAAISLPVPTISRNLQIKQGWMTPTVVEANSTIQVFADVNGKDVVEVKAYYDLGNGQPYALATLKPTESTSTWGGEFKLPYMPNGHFGNFRIMARDSAGNIAYWPGLSIVPAAPK
ncbi:hypothetical protein [Parachitinimonas caeni]|uniref:Uncharacterized protein n=1 Tax=Parachitinimonas caeni TaxID=3031301 RepID=A0ABT7DQU6_9NEIS|nr:hypothetical protein [Parachitinimonas caeni]MDK2122447.1 hypothetical protein [Parachitinimonas caeni]